MERVQLFTKCFSRGINSEHSCSKEFTVCYKSGKPVLGLISLLVLVAAVSTKSQCLLQFSCSPWELFWLGVLVMVTILYFMNYLSAVKQETLLLVMPLGLQMSTRKWSGKQDTTWIPWCRIGNFMIFDVITGQKVIFCLAVSVRDQTGGEEKTLILFGNIRPRLNHLETIYKELQTSLDKYRIGGAFLAYPEEPPLAQTDLCKLSERVDPP